MKMRRARVKPYIQCVFVLHIIGRVAAQKLVDVQRLPRFNAVRLNQLRHALQQFRRVRVQLPRHFMQEKWHRHAPLALARQCPVRTVGNHVVQTRFPPRWEKLRRFHCAQSGVTQALAVHRLIHRGEPLRRRTVDQRRFVAPAVHVAVRVLHHFQQCTDLF